MVISTHLGYLGYYFLKTKYIVSKSILMVQCKVVQPRFNEILVITNIIQKSKSKIYLDITNKCQHVTET